jgi:CubicO group peptidase (beta-lactamase class C family)
VSRYIEVFNDRRANISLRHLLDMTSGLAFPKHEHETMFLRDDHLAYALAVGVEKPAGEVFEYNNVNSMLLSEVLHRATGVPADQLLAERILSKIGIQRYTLWRDSAGNPMTYCCIDMSARDYARFGLLFARSGRWGDQQIISQEFVDTSFSEVWSDIPSSTIEHTRGYGMHWWVSKNDQQASIFNASGKFGQYVFVDRANDVVFTRITRYASTGASVQNWGALQALTWISNVTLLRKAGEFLTLIGLLDPVADIATPITYESGVSNEFFSDYSTIIDALVEVSQPVMIGDMKADRAAALAK